MGFAETIRPHLCLKLGIVGHKEQEAIPGYWCHMSGTGSVQQDCMVHNLVEMCVKAHKVYISGSHFYMVIIKQFIVTKLFIVDGP